MDRNESTQSNELPGLEQLESLIGQRVRYQGHVWQIVELLEHEQSLVLQAEDDSSRIVTDAQGDPVSDLPRTLEIPLRDPESGQRNPALEQIKLLSEGPDEAP